MKILDRVSGEYQYKHLYSVIHLPPSKHNITNISIPGALKHLHCSARCSGSLVRLAGRSSSSHAVLREALQTTTKQPDGPWDIRAGPMPFLSVEHRFRFSTPLSHKSAVPSSAHEEDAGCISPRCRRRTHRCSKCRLLPKSADRYQHAKLD